MTRKYNSNAKSLEQLRYDWTISNISLLLIIVEFIPYFSTAIFHQCEEGRCAERTDELKRNTYFVGNRVQFPAKQPKCKQKRSRREITAAFKTTRIRINNSSNRNRNLRTRNCGCTLTQRRYPRIVSQANPSSKVWNLYAQLCKCIGILYAGYTSNRAPFYFPRDWEESDSRVILTNRAVRLRSAAE